MLSGNRKESIPNRPPPLASSPVHWDVKNITRANHCFITNHISEIGETFVVRIVKVHLRVKKKKKRSVQ